MPVTTKRIRSKYRVVEADTGELATNARGTPVDGGGHMSQQQAESQVRAINASLQQRGKTK